MKFLVGVLITLLSISNVHANDFNYYIQEPYLELDGEYIQLTRVNKPYYGVIGYEFDYPIYVYDPNVRYKLHDGFWRSMSSYRKISKTGYFNRLVIKSGGSVKGIGSSYYEFE